MRKKIVLALSSLFIFMGTMAFSQQDKDCYQRYKDAFDKRGAYHISDNIYRNVMLSFFDGNEVYCIRGKVRVEGGYITSIFYYYDDNTEKLYDKKFHAAGGGPPAITNGISQEIINADREKLRVVFVDQLKPKKKKLQEMPIPDDL